MTALNIVRIAWALIFGYWAARILTWAAQDAIRARRARHRQRRADVRRVRALGDALGGDDTASRQRALEACDVALWDLEFEPTGEDA